ALTRAAFGRIRPCNLEDDLERLRQADWVLEAIVENLEAKQRLWSRLAAYLRDDAIASTNTSGLSIAEIATALPATARRRFLGTHFFNPPRYLKLVELIPLPETDPAVLKAIRRFAEEELGKGVVIARDTPNFIANRIGCYGLMVTLHAMQEFGLGPDAVDQITGPPMGRPRSATFRTLDLVGLDVFADVAANMRQRAADPAERDAFTLPGWIQAMLERGWLGEKAGQGFYRRVEGPHGREIWVLDPETLHYRPQRPLAAPSLAALAGVDDPAERLRRLTAADDMAGRFAWTVLKRTLLYTAERAPEISADLAGIDRAMRWGFGWELGPFEAWHALGAAAVAERLRAEGERLPKWVEAAVAAGGFYRERDGKLVQVTFTGDWAPWSDGAGDPEPGIANFGSLAVGSLGRQPGPVLLENAGATLYDLGDDVVFLDFHAPKQAIGPDLVTMLHRAADRVEQAHGALIISSRAADHFCVGANLWLILLAVQEGEWGELEAMVRSFQQALLRLKYLEKPVIVAPFGRTLGGGAELVMAGSRVVAAAETYIGLVEVGAGLIPAGGGSKELWLRALTATAAAPAPGESPAGGDPAAMLLGTPDLQPALNRVFATIGMARVAGSAFEARELGYLRPNDAIVPSRDHLLAAAKRHALALLMAGYRPPAPVEVPVLG
ncbi:MAG TPA: 3-hydroxyacyl-CoA dehydrogenase/enoyl-CoA hydratase family protein, partial [Bacillota bacterium]